MQEIGKPVTYIVYLDTYIQDIHDDIWAPHRALDDGTLGPGSSTLHTWAKVLSTRAPTLEHTPSPHALCYQTQTHTSTNTHPYIDRGEAWVGCMYHCTVVRWRVPLLSTAVAAAAAAVAAHAH